MPRVEPQLLGSVDTNAGVWGWDRNPSAVPRMGTLWRTHQGCAACLSSKACPSQWGKKLFCLTSAPCPCSGLSAQLRIWGPCSVPGARRLRTLHRVHLRGLQCWPGLWGLRQRGSLWVQLSGSSVWGLRLGAWVWSEHSSAGFWGLRLAAWLWGKRSGSSLWGRGVRAWIWGKRSGSSI